VARELGALRAHPCPEIRHQRRDALTAHREALIDRPTVDLALDVEDRIDALDASKASGAMTASLPLAFAVTSASSKNLRRPCAQQLASVIGPGLRPAS
jgi:hypothetical protein